MRGSLEARPRTVREKTHGVCRPTHVLPAPGHPELDLLPAVDGVPHRHLVRGKRDRESEAPEGERPGGVSRWSAEMT